MQLNLVMAVILLLASLLTLFLCFRSFQLRESPGAFCFAMLMFMLTIWMLFQGLELLPFSMAIRIWLSKLSYIGIVYIAPFVFCFVYEFTNKSRWQETDFLGWLFLLPTAILGLVFTNEQHHLIWTLVEPSKIISRLIYHHGVGVITLAIYSYVLIIFSFFLFLIYIFNQKNLFRNRLFWLLIAGVLPLVSSMAYIFQWTPVNNIDFSAISLTISCVICAFSVLYFRIFEIRPIAYQALFDHLTDGVIAIDPQFRLILANPSIIKWFHFSNHDTGKDIFTIMPILQKSWIESFDTPYEFTHQVSKSESKTYELTSHPLAQKPYSRKKVGILLQISDISTRKWQEEKIKQSQKRFDQVTELAHEVFWETDKNIIITYISPYVQDVLGYEPDMVMNNKEIWNLILPEHINDKKTIENLKDLIKSRQSVNDFQLAFMTKSQSILYCIINALPIFDKGEFYGYRGAAFDITEIINLENIRTELITTLSHELRTPLTAIKESINIVSDGLAGDINKTQKETLEIGKRNIIRLSRIINNVLDFQKSNNGKTVFAPQMIDPIPVLLDAFETMKLHANEKRLMIKWDVSDRLPEIYADPDMLLQVLINLLHNAIKFTDKGQITLKAFTENDKLHIVVEDTGIGIRKEDMNKLFLSFSQISPDEQQSLGGSGLGLAISKRIVLLHNGDIWAESEIKMGSQFHVVLPLKKSEKG